MTAATGKSAAAEEAKASEFTSTTPTYHTVKDAQYTLPNDAPEHARLETQARHLSAMMDGQVIHAPILKLAIKRVLDVGCGTGLVTDYLGQQFPDAEVIGLDLSPVPTMGRQRPVNVRFVQGNIITQQASAWKSAASSTTVASELPDTASFDLIYSRLLICGIPDWNKYIRTGLSLLRPGGWMEVHEPDYIWYSHPSMEILSDSWPWFQRLRSVSHSRGLDFECGSKASAWMRQAGFVDVEVHEYYWPFGGERDSKKEMREFGAYSATVLADTYWHLITKTMHGTRATEEEVRGMREAMRRDFRPEQGKRWRFYVTAGRKPGGRGSVPEALHLP